LAVVAAIGLGLEIAAMAHQPRQDGWHYVPAPSADAALEPEGIGLSTKSGKRFATLETAAGEAQDGDTILIHGNGSFSASSIDLKGKSLTIRADANSRPRLEFTRKQVERGWESLFFADRPLTLEGLDLV